MAPLKIKLHGRHRLERVPEIGVVNITAKSTSLSKVITVNEIQRISEKLHGMIAPLAIRTEDGGPAPDAAIIDWSVSPMYCEASQWSHPPASSTEARTQVHTQASAHATPQASAHATPQASAHASTQASPQANTQASPQARNQARNQAHALALFNLIMEFIDRDRALASTQSTEARTQSLFDIIMAAYIQTSPPTSAQALAQDNTHALIQAIGQASIRGSPQAQASTQSSRLTPWGPICRTHSAAIELHVTFGNFTKLREFANQITEIPGVSIDEICWDLSKASHELADAEVREMALLNALHLANDYAKSLGRDVLPVEVRPRRVHVEIPRERMQTQVRNPSIALRSVQIVPRNLVFTNSVKVIFGPV
ncbi:hypothetical protein MYU51_005551 [Penicillium brevicompactum]